MFSSDENVQGQIMNDPYRSPDAVVEDEQVLGNFQSMPRTHTLLVLLFYLGSMGLYMPYWAVKRAQRFNAIYPRGQVNMIFTYTITLIFILSTAMDVADLASSFLDNPLELETRYESLYLILAFSSSLGFLFWAFYFRAKLNTFLTQELNNSFDKPGLVLTFFFGIIYLNFKINQTLDELRETKKSIQNESIQ